MYIHEAVAEAIKRKCYIARKAWGEGYRFRVEPTDTPDCCICHSQAMRNPARGWQPTAEDILADDWILRERYSGFKL